MHGRRKPPPFNKKPRSVRAALKARTWQERQNLNSTRTRNSAPPPPSSSHLRGSASPPGYRTGGTREQRARREAAEGRGQCQEGTIRALRAATSCAQGPPSTPGRQPRPCRVTPPNHGAARTPPPPRAPGAAPLSLTVFFAATMLLPRAGSGGTWNTGGWRGAVRTRQDRKSVV